MSQPNFNMMWNAYPAHDRYPNLLSLHTFIGGALQKNIHVSGFSPNGNTCAVRLSRALNYGAMPISATIVKRLKIQTLTGNDGKLYIYRVQELKAYLKEALAVSPVKVSADFDHAFLGKRGIVAMDIIGWRGASGHLALWDGKNFRENGYDDYRNQRDNPATPNNEGTTTGMTLWHF